VAESIETLISSFIFFGGGCVTVHLLPCIDQAWFVPCPPTEIPHARRIGRLLVEPGHIWERERLERRSGAAAIGEHVEEGEDGGEAGRAEGGQEVVGEGRAAVRGRDGCDGEDLEGEVFCQVGGEVSAVEATLICGIG
jgi:hypothetical protein